MYAEDEETFLARGKETRDTLARAALRGTTWPSPRGSDGEKGGPNQRGSKGDRMLPSAVMWLTPSVEDAGRQGKAENWRQYEEGGRTRQARLRNQVMWPTPSVGDVTGGHTSRSGNRKDEPLLNRAVKLAGGPLTRQTYPTPIGGGRTHDPGLNSSASSRRKMGGRAPQTHLLKSEKWYQQVMGQLNPEWVEWLMGWPVGWTALEPLGTDRYQRWLRLHGGC
jgi:hypothetical protein